MKKGRRFNGESGSDVNDRLGEVGETKPRKKMSFASRFAMERGLGNKTFTYNGKEYNTELAKPKVDSRPFEKVPLNTAAIERRAKILSTGPNYEAAPRGRAVTRDEAMEERRAAQNTAAPGGSAPLADTMKRGGKVKRFAAGGMTKGVEKKLPTSKQMGALDMKSGGMKESKAMVGKEVNFMKKKGAPKSMIKHEAAEMGAMKKGGMAKYAKGGGVSLMDTVEKYNEGAKETVAKGEKNTRDAGDAAVNAFKKGNYGTALKEGAKGLGSAAKTLAVDVPTETFRAGMNRLKYGEKMAAGGMAKYARGGGIESKGKTKGTIVRMASGGVVKFAKGGGIESRGKTKGTMIKMKGC